MDGGFGCSVLVAGELCVFDELPALDQGVHFFDGGEVVVDAVFLPGTRALITYIIEREQ